MLHGKAFTVYFCCKLLFSFSCDWIKLLVCQGVLEFKIWTFFRNSVSFVSHPGYFTNTKFSSRAYFRNGDR